MTGTEPDAKPGRSAQRRWMGAALICLTAILCLGVGFGVAATKKKAAQRPAAGAAAVKTAKAKPVRTRTAARGSLARAKAAALAKARAATRKGGGLTTAATNMPPSPAARDYFGKQAGPAPLAARSIGSYVRGCLAGGKMLPVNGPAWQAMRLSRNRNWGHPLLVSYVERLATDAQKLDNWPGLLVGDLAQPMGGPMPSGHASHQIGLDADIWLKPMPPKTLTNEERENISADSVINADQLAINPQVWQPGHVQLLKRAASYPNVARIFVHPAIKKALCEAPGTDRGWLSKVRPWWGHHYHFHVRLACPPGAEGCEDQPAAGPDDGCGKEVESWLKRLKTPIIQKVPPVQKAPITMAQLPAECSTLVGYEPPPPVPMGPPLPARKAPSPSAMTTPVSSPPPLPVQHSAQPSRPAR
jgi:penicillin-insensitive murein DD-endopeptidase